jgi:hypothetical protein
MESFIDVKPGKLLEVLEKEKATSISKQWGNVFLKNNQGVNTRSYKWHIFSSGRYDALDGDAALNEYSKHIAARYYVMSNDGDVLLTDLLPQELNYNDVYVFPENFAWTMAFTHEEGWLGPYFAKHKSYKKLELENELYRKKLAEKERAMKNGWI